MDSNNFTQKIQSEDSKKSYTNLALLLSTFKNSLDDGSLLGFETLTEYGYYCGFSSN